MRDDEGVQRCPRCKTIIEGPARAKSRVDNETYICPDCGVKEGLWVFEHPEGQLPDLSNPIPSLTQASRRVLAAIREAQQ